MNPEDSQQQQAPEANPSADEQLTPEQAEAVSSVLDEGDEATDPQQATEKPSEPEAAPTAEPTNEGDNDGDEGDKSDNQDDSKDQSEEGESQEAPVDPKEIARQRYEERQAYKSERDARIDQEATEYLKGAEDEYDGRLRAMEVQRYKETVEANEASLVTQFERVKASPELQMFNPDSENFNKPAYEKALRDYHAGYLAYDELGNIVGVKHSLFEHFKETAAILGSAVKSGQVQQVKAERQVRAKADAPPAAQPKESAKDPILDTLLSD